jgi:hypothetical protein
MQRGKADQCLAKCTGEAAANLVHRFGGGRWTPVGRVSTERTRAGRAKLGRRARPIDIRVAATYRAVALTKKGGPEALQVVELPIEIHVPSACGCALRSESVAKVGKARAASLMKRS